ncbi:MAG: M23 family metallopeptidase [Alkalinema sp. RL_2_19]|nr:M23 family metallopeptidase [Alkalinema sp. RL_2_19]
MVAPNLPAMGREDAFLPGGGVSSNGFIMPSKGLLSSGYGWRWGRMHRGIDIAAPVGTPIVASASGRVSYARWNDGGFGYLVEVEHQDGSMTRYAHNNRILVKEGQEVAQGQQISEMGSTGFSTGPHLHFEIHKRGRGAVNPMAFLNNQS